MVFKLAPLPKLWKIFLVIFFSLPAVLWAQPAAPTNLSGDALKTWLKDNWYTGFYTYRTYAASRQQMYSSIDVFNDSVYCVYTGFRMPRGSTSNLDPINCEHTIPQSFFNTNTANTSSQINTMTSDIHHLFPSHENANSTRSNFPFAIIANNLSSSWNGITGNNLYTSTSTAPTVNIERWSQYRNSEYEPREDHKGDAARAIFYFFTMYPNAVVGGIERVAELNTLYQWHLNDPVSAKENTRNTRIGNIQGNRNPYVVYPELVARSYNFSVACSAPSLQANNLSLTATSSTSIRVSYSRGNGEGTLLLVKAASEVNANPADNTTYSASTSFGAGSQIGIGNFVVAMGTSNTINISGLQAGVSYFVKAFEYNCSGSNIKFKVPATSGSFSVTTPSCNSPSQQVSNFQVGASTSSTLSLTFNGGNGAARIIIAREGSAVSATPLDNTTYTANADFSQANSIATGQKIVYNGTGNGLTLTGLNPSSTYHFAAFEYDCATGQQRYNTSFTTGNRAQGNTSAPSTGALSELIISEYIEGLSNEKYVEIFNGTGQTVNLANYQLRLFSNGAGSASISNALSGTLADGAVRVYRNSQASLTQYEALSALNFNGDDALVLFNTSTNQVVDLFGQIGCDPGNAWTASGGFSTLDKTLRRKANSCTGVIANNEANCGFPTLSTNWDVFEPTNTAGLGSHTASCASVCVAPSGSPSLSIAALTANSAQLTVSPQNAGNQVLVVVKQGLAAFNPVPENGTNYIANSDFSLNTSSILDTGKVVYIGAATTFSLSGLSNASSYRVQVFEFNPANACYNINGFLNQNFNTLVSVPSTPTNFSGNISSSNSIQLYYSALNATNNAKGFLLLGAVNAQVSANPLNGVAYSVGSTIGNATVLALISSPTQVSTLHQSLTNGNVYHYSLVPFNLNAALGNSSIIYGTGRNTSVVLASIAISLNGSTICQNVGGGTSATLIASITSSIAFPAGNELVLELSDVNGNFASPVEISRTSTQQATLNISFSLSSSTAIGAGYKVRVRSTQYGLVSEGSNAIQVQASAQEVSDFELTASDAALSGAFTLPSTCVDELLVMYRASSANTFIPSGNGVNYTLGATFNNSIVAYKGGLSSFSISGLSNGTTYFVKVFTRSGTAWSAGIELSATPSNITAGLPSAGDIIVNEIWQQGISNTANDLFISEYFEGSSNNKLIEIYNPTNSAIDLGAAGYKLRWYVNGSASPGGTPLNLSGTIPSQGVIVVGNTSTNTTIRNELSTRGVAVSYSNSSVLTFNGNDALELVKGASNIRVDLFGNTGEDPGTRWTQGSIQTLDRTLRRRPSAIEPRVANSTNFAELASDWIQEAQDFSSNLGFHKAEVNRMKMISFTTLKALNLQGLSITDRGECLSGRLIDLSNDNQYTFPNNANLSTVPAGTIIQIFWSESGTNDFDATDGLIRVFTNFSTARQISTGEQIQVYAGNATVQATCGTGSAKTHTTISAFNYGLNNWSTSNPTFQDEGVNPSSAINFGGSLARVGQSIYLKSSPLTINSNLFSTIATTPADYYEVAASKANAEPIVPNISFPVRTRVSSPDNASLSAIEGNSARLSIGSNNWNGTLDGFIVILHTASAMGTPSGSYSCYTANADYSLAPSVVVSNALSATDYCATPSFGNGKVLSFSASRNISITGLSEGTTYFYRIYGFNGVGKTLTYTSEFIAGNFQTKAPQIELSLDNTLKTNGSTTTINNLILGVNRNLNLKVKNTGTLNLSVSNLNLSTGLSLQGNIGGALLPNEERNYTIVLNPGVQSAFTGTITLVSNALNANSFVLNINGSPKADSLSRLSLITTGYSNSINYIQHQQSSLNTALEGVPVIRFSVQDAAASGISDNVATRIGGLTFYADKLPYIRAAALVKVGEGIIAGTFNRNVSLKQLTFTPSNFIEIAANASSTFELRVSFSNEVEDEEVLQISLLSLNGFSNQFSVPVLNAALISPIQFNKMEVIATALRFIQQPIVSQGAGQGNLQAQIAAVDANNIVDIGVNNCSLSIGFSEPIGSTLQDNSYVIQGGLVDIQSLGIYENKPSLQLQVSALGACSSLGSVNSNNFAVNFTRFLIAQKRLISGDSLSNSAWESVLIGAPFGTSSEGYYGNKPDGVEEEVAVNKDFSWNLESRLKQLHIASGKNLKINAPVVIEEGLQIEGALEIKQRLKLAGGAQLTLKSGGVIKLNHPSINTANYYDTTLWNGLESVEANSEIQILHYPQGGILSNALQSSIINGKNVCFDKLTIAQTTTQFSLSEGSKQIANILTLENTALNIQVSAQAVKRVLDSLVLKNGARLMLANVGDTLLVRNVFQTGGSLEALSTAKGLIQNSQSFLQANGVLNNLNIEFIGSQVKEFGALGSNLGISFKAKEGTLDLIDDVQLGLTDSLIISSEAVLNTLENDISGNGTVLFKPEAILEISVPSNSTTSAIRGLNANVVERNREMKYLFSGSNNQVMDASLPDSLTTLIIDKPSGKLTLLEDKQVLQRLEIKTGQLYLNNADLTLGSAANACLIPRGDDSLRAYIVTNGSGKLKLYAPVLNTSYLLPLGDSLHYSPFFIKPLGGNVTASTQFVGSVRSVLIPFLSAEPAVNNYLNRYWQVEALNYGSPNYEVSFLAPLSDLVGNRNFILPVKWNASSVQYGANTAAGGFDTEEMMGFRLGNLNSFSDFGAGDGETVLPVQLLYFKGFLHQHKAVFQWATAIEKNNEGFELQFSADGNVFKPLKFIEGKGNTSSTQFYVTDVLNATEGYYRLVQRDWDGTITSFTPIYLKNVLSETGLLSSLKIMGNPSEALLLNGISSNASLAASLWNAQGKCLLSLSMPNTDLQKTLFEKSKWVPAGYYQLRLFDENGELKVLPWIKMNR